MIRLGEWLPDRAPLGNPGLVVATNALPAASGYVPRRKHAPLTDALDDRALGAIQAIDQDGNVFQYAGDKNKLYQLVSSLWQDRSKSGRYVTPGEQAWEMVAWKNKILATNYGDFPQELVLGDTAFSDLTTDFRARHLAVIRSFVAAANTTDPVDGNVTSRVRWSANGDETDWTVSQVTLSDFQDLRNAEVLRLFGGEFGIVLQRQSTWRMTFVGAPVVFQFDEVLPGIGTLAPSAAVRSGDSIFFLSDAGFYQLIQGTQARAIGASRVDQTVLSELDSDYLHRITTAPDPTGQTIWWAYPGTGHSGGTPNRAAVYDRVLDRWSVQDLEAPGVELLWQAGTLGLTLEELDTVSTSIDALPASLDSSRWKGGQPVLAAFDGTHKSGFFDGDKATAVFETGEREIHSGRTTRLNAWRPLVDGGTVRSRLSTRNRETDSPTVGSYRTQSASGRFTQRANARFFRFGLEVSGDWEHALGVQVEPSEARRGERRG